jgi:hypothetical protein
MEKKWHSLLSEERPLSRVQQNAEAFLKLKADGFLMPSDQI